jgi:predicted acylesterase/phospholipase RssA
MNDFIAASDECDIIMKGGITSGVVYPKAILALAARYRFRCIGGTSAGAIAAVMTAAAEYNRSNGGFDAIAALPEEVEKKLLSLFQPAPQFKPLFDSAMDAMNGAKMPGLFRLMAAHWRLWSPVAVIFGALAILSLLGCNALAAILFLFIGFAASLLYGFYAIGRKTLSDLEAADFGLCPGPTQPDLPDQGLSDWLADKIELAAGRMQPGGPRPNTPLTFGDLWGEAHDKDPSKDRHIDLRVMTTNLSIRQPHALPELDANHYFNEAEFRRLFPGWVVDFMVKQAGAIGGKAVVPMKKLGFLPMPVQGALPLIVAARMSLSFPILFTTVPLYRVRHRTGRVDGSVEVERMLFSDGGLSSNFPIHFFDALLPRRPTFGVSLEAYDETDPLRRVHLSMKAGQGIQLNAAPIKGLAGFLFRLVDAAKDWQDRIRSTLPGYRERVVNIYLKDSEGGLNLNMSKATIANLVGYGGRAGALVTGTSSNPEDHDNFDFDDHRWRRFLVAFATLEEALQEAEGSWRQCGTRAFIQAYKKNPASYNSSPLQWRNGVFDRFDGLMNLVTAWGQGNLRDANDGNNIPKPKTNIRISPKF